MPRLAMLTPAADYDAAHDWAYDNQAAALRDAGAEVTSVRWTEAADLSRFDLVLAAMCWSPARPAAWAASPWRCSAATTLINDPGVLRWNSDKRYLAELSAAGIATVPTLEVDHLNEAALAAAHGVFATDQLVVKPPVSAGASGTFRLGPGEPVPEEVHGARMMIQPWLGSVIERGETSLLLFDGKLSHAVIKRPKPGDYRVQPHHGGTTEQCDAPADGLAIHLPLAGPHWHAVEACALAEAVLAAV